MAAGGGQQAAVAVMPLGFVWAEAWLVRTGDRKLVPGDPGFDIRRESRGLRPSFRKVTSQVLCSQPIVIKGQLILCAFQVTRP